ncbi:hypothetical protein [Streptomyces cyaneofuscatus]|uniref:hypothetical protein n=1 Tax=Streptomyces cyaneofuscatus TaxID=66883 RepID=UPI00379B5EDF
MPRPDFTGGAKPSGTQTENPLLGQRHDGTLHDALPTTRKEGVRVQVQRSKAVLRPASSP